MESQVDHSLYVYHHGFTLIYFSIYVNDIIIIGADIHAINKVISLLHDNFAIKDMSEPSFFLGIEAIRSDHGLYLS